MTFKDLNLNEEILKTLEEMGHHTPTPIQEQAIPKVLGGADLRASAQTGTGKTAAFILPALNRLTVPSSIRGHGPRILILVPTRELAMQVADEAAKYSKYMRQVKTVCIYGGAPYPTQNRQLARPYDILVATPGRLIDHVERGRINFSRIEMFVLDEADRMLDMGFITPVEKISSLLPETHQTLMFSATLNKNVMGLSDRLLNNPVEIKVVPDHVESKNIEQRLHYVGNMNDKNRLLDHLLKDLPFDQAIIFTATKFHADQLLNRLLDLDHSAAALHGDMNQRQRTRTMCQLKDGEIRILVATDVAARGIDVQTITHVINFDLPMSVEDYVHRIGRTGRAGAKGVALSFVSAKDMHLVKRIEQMTGHKLTPHTIPGMDIPAHSASSAPPRRGGSRSSFGRSPRGGGGGGGGDRGGSRDQSGGGGYGGNRGGSGGGGGYGGGGGGYAGSRRDQPSSSEGGGGSDGNRAGSGGGGGYGGGRRDQPSGSEGGGGYGGNRAGSGGGGGYGGARRDQSSSSEGGGGAGGYRGGSRDQTSGGGGYSGNRGGPGGNRSGPGGNRGGSGGGGGYGGGRRDQSSGSGGGYASSGSRGGYTGGGRRDQSSGKPSGNGGGFGGGRRDQPSRTPAE
ncbi:MAG: DEAD/DEAH box helicase [Parachlamydiaceae bacterium]|nr:DEAD/DEAH box helicase [Parachlamydiaceae bacterium]